MLGDGALSKLAYEQYVKKQQDGYSQKIFGCTQTAVVFSPPEPETVLPGSYTPPPVSTIGLLEFPTHRKIELE